MPLNEETGAALVGRRLEYTAIAAGGERWAREWFPDDWATHIRGATITEHFPGDEEAPTDNASPSTTYLKFSTGCVIPTQVLTEFQLLQLHCYRPASSIQGFCQPSSCDNILPFTTLFKQGSHAHYLSDGTSQLLW